MLVFKREVRSSRNYETVGFAKELVRRKLTQCHLCKRRKQGFSFI